MMVRISALLAVTMAFTLTAKAASARERDGNYVVLHGNERGLVAIQTPSPPYPAPYRLRRYEAAMRLRVYVNASGKIDDIKVRKFLGDPVLASYAIRKARETFVLRPYVLDGKTTPACFDYPIVFYIAMGEGPVSSLWYRGVKPDQIIDLYGK